MKNLLAETISKHIVTYITLGSLITGCTTASLSAKREMPSTESAASRPILYLDQGGDKFVLMGIYLDGRQLTLPMRYYAASPAIPVWSPDGKWFAYATTNMTTGKATIELGNLQGDIKTIFTFEKGGFASDLVWSPDGARIAVVLFEEPPSALSVAVINVAEQKVLSRYELRMEGRDFPKPSEIGPWVKSNFRWSPDGQKILIAGEIVVIIDTVKGIVEKVADKPLLVEWVPNSDGVYYFDVLGVPGKEKGSIFERIRELGDFYFKPLGPSKPIKLMDKEQTKALGLSSDRALIYGLVTLSPKGAKLAIWGGKGDVPAEVSSSIHIYDLTSGGMIDFGNPNKSFQTDAMLMALDWGPDENSLAVAAIDKEGINIKRLSLSTGTWNTLARISEEETISMFYMLGRRVMSWTQ